MLPFKLIYGDGYDLNLGAHVFPSQKFRMIRYRLLEQGISEPAAIFFVPEPAADEDVLRVHCRSTAKTQDGNASEAKLRDSKCRFQGNWWKRAGWRLEVRSWRDNARCETAGRRISAAGSTMRVPIMARVFARFTMLPWRSGGCSTTA